MSSIAPLGILVRDDRPDEDVLDEVYRRYAPSNPFLPVTHFIDHATMGSEALVGLGLGRQVRRWSEKHAVRPYQPPTGGVPIASAWQDALGRQDCHGDWLRHLERELESVPFPQVLGRWVPRFAHEVGAFLFHGLIRTAHATRALAHRDTPARRGELARGLALWAIGIRTPSPEANSEREDGADSGPGFVDFARLGAVSFVTAPSFPNLHLVTGPMAYCLVAPYLDWDTHRRATRSFGQTHARASQSFAALKDRADAAPVASFTPRHLMALAGQGDAHPIKLTEAALRAYEQTRDDIFLKAAGKALEVHSLRALISVARATLARRAER
ncbi:MAG TPA: hypothetical protein VGL81_12725 [Polyangiaceae bacterium]|jgi:hypothetical protein